MNRVLTDLAQSAPVTDDSVIAALDSAHAALEGKTDYHSPVLWREWTADAGLAALDLNPSLGGSGWSSVRMGAVFAHCGRYSLDLRDVPGVGHGRLLFESRAHADTLRQVAQGKAFVAVALTEPSAGSDLHGMQTVAEPCGDGYRLTGEKLYVARLEDAQYVVLFAKVVRSGTDPAVTAFLLPLDLPGLERVRLQALGLGGVSFGGLRLAGVQIPRGARVGGEGQGFALFAKHFTFWRTAMSASAIGCARSAIDQAIDWLTERQAFGGPIGRFTHLQQELAEHTASLHMCWLLVQSVMERIDRRQPAFYDAAMAKAETIDRAVAAVQWAIRVHGARGVTSDFDLEKRLRDLIALSIADGTRDVLRGQVARGVLGNELYEQSLGRQIQATVLGKTRSRRFW